MMANEIFDAVLSDYQTSMFVLVCLFVFERIRPVESRQPISGIAVNLFIALLLITATQFFMRGFAPFIASFIPPVSFHPLLTISPPTNWYERIGCELLVLFLYDFFTYWLHRIEHYVPFLWQFHKLHHDDMHLNASTTNRHHPVEALLRVPLVLLPLVVLFDLPFAALSNGVSLGILLPAISHMNLRLELGRLTPLVVGPQLHRLHHSRIAEHHNKNFANIFPFWDLVFGTYLAPTPGEFPPTGLDSDKNPAEIVNENPCPIDKVRDLAANCIS